MTGAKVMLPAGFLLLVMLPLLAADEKKAEWDGSRLSPVHRIPLKDELDQPIIPGEPNPMPFSTRRSCAPCHDYSRIEKGLHFRNLRSAGENRPGEPWIRVEERTATFLPLSWRPMPGVWNPRQAGLTNWDLTLLFGRHMNGGGVAEPEDAAVTPESRWDVSGKVEINCLGCHQASGEYDHSEWAKQILRQNFRWAATASSGLGEVGGMASRLPGTWDLFDGPNPDDSEWAVVPSVRYLPQVFDSKHRAFLDIKLKPDDRRCLACHSTAPVGTARVDFDDDVHTHSGLSCVDCHRNDIGHDMIRGDESEAASHPHAHAADFTCAGCHLGREPEKGGRGWSGRLGAPYPKHSGIPAVHFKRLTCTVCHSGPLPADKPDRVRTARANRLGIFGIARWVADLPVIVEAVPKRTAGGKIAPHRLFWPAYWGVEQEGRTVPLSPENVLEVSGGILDAVPALAAVLTALSPVVGLGETPALQAGGKGITANIDGDLTAVPLAPGEKFAWSVLRPDGELSPLLPKPVGAEAAGDAESAARIQGILEALASVPKAPGRPVLRIGKTIYRVKDGALAPGEYAGSPVSEPELGWETRDGVEPLIPDVLLRSAVAVAGTEHQLTEEQVRLVLGKLSARKRGKYFYVANGRLFRLNERGELTSRMDPRSEAVAWPLAHRVRPARQALGINGCGDCHGVDSPFFFAKIQAEGPLLTEKNVTRRAVSYMGLNDPYQRLFGLSFSGRRPLKWLLFGCVLAAGLVLLLALMIVVGRLTGLIQRRR